MRASLILASAFTTLVAALPAWDQSPYHQSPFRIEQCSGVMPPFDMYLLNEENPNELTRVQSLFQVSQQTGKHSEDSMPVTVAYGRHHTEDAVC